MTKIEWCDVSWNPVTGCDHAGSPGCDNCYARRMAYRLRGRCGYPARDPFSITIHRYRFDRPYFDWRKPRRVFVNSMGDLFHEEVSKKLIAELFLRILACPQHTFLILTKRPVRMKDILLGAIPYIKGQGQPESRDLFCNIWFGVTAETQEMVDVRVPELMSIPNINRFVSVEPMLEPIDLSADLDSRNHINPLHWVICGAETGPGKRPMELRWARDLLAQCRRTGVPFFFKKDSTGKLPEGMPREFPEHMKLG